MGKVQIAMGEKAGAKTILLDLMKKNPGYEKREEVEGIIDGL